MKTVLFKTIPFMGPLFILLTFEQGFAEKGFASDIDVSFPKTPGALCAEPKMPKLASDEEKLAEDPIWSMDWNPNDEVKGNVHKLSVKIHQKANDIEDLDRTTSYKLRDNMAKMGLETASEDPLGSKMPKLSLEDRFVDAGNWEEMLRDGDEIVNGKNLSTRTGYQSYRKLWLAFLNEREIVDRAADKISSQSARADNVAVKREFLAFEIVYLTYCPKLMSDRDVNCKDPENKIKRAKLIADFKPINELFKKELETSLCLIKNLASIETEKNKVWDFLSKIEQFESKIESVTSTNVNPGIEKSKN